jgi:hypothetical protein
VTRIPVFLCVDLEPDERQVSASDDSWAGVDAMFAHLEELRPRLAEASGEPVRFLWFVRCDPQIDFAFGSAGHLLTRSAKPLERLLANGDRIGLHVHAWRRDESDGQWVAEYGDTGWIRHCVETSFETFRTHFGTDCELHRFGDHWLSTELIPLLETHGVRFDLTMEPGVRGRRSVAPGERSAGSIPDYTRVPREPYRPSRTDFRRPDAAADSRLWLVPLSAADPAPAMPLGWRVGRRVRFPFRPTHRPLQMFRPWTSPSAYWDLVQRHVDALERPYLAFAIRSGDPEAPDERRVREILDHLPGHPLAARLRLTDPDEGLRTLGYLAP